MELQRPHRSEEELGGLPPLGTTERDGAVRAQISGFAPETIVCLLREYAAIGAAAMFEVCGHALVGLQGVDGRWRGGHCEAIVLSLAKYYRFHVDPQTLRLFRLRCHNAMWRAIHVGSTKKPFWEMRFGRAFKYRCLDIARSVVREERHESEAGIDLVELTADNAGAAGESLDDALIQKIVKEDFQAAIRRLPPRQAQAAHLSFIENYPVTSAKGHSVASVLKVSEREVYKLLEKARAALARDGVLRKHYEGK